jgi:anti-sigma regulatory factor (Ser/Thr protein kinase)
MMTGQVPAEGPPVARIALPLSTDSPRRARISLTPVLHRLGLSGDLVDLAVLLASELVTNAVLHGRGDPVVEVRATSREVWIGVEDPDSRLPQVQHINRGALGGRGMHLIDRLANTWGAAPIAGDGKIVWFTLPRSD